MISTAGGSDRYARRLDGQAGDVSELGGKAAATDRLIGSGLPVPDSAVITASAYREFVAASGLADLVRRWVGPEPATAEEVDAAFLAPPMPAVLQAAIESISAQLGSETALAVRSSATVEDLAGTSFAGQYRSLLDIRGPVALAQAIRIVWASLWHPAPRAYRAAHGVASEGVAMAVLLMEMIPSRQAGVAFTVDPTGDPGTIRVESVEGPGELLVSGAVTPARWIVPRPSLGPADQAPLDHVTLNRVTLDLPAPIAEVAALALRAEVAAGCPQDIEWVWDGARLAIVQARPITGGPVEGDGFDTPIDDAQLTTAGIAEMLPGVLAPMVWEQAGFCVEEAFRSTFDRLGAMGEGLSAAHGLIRRVRGQAALDLSRLKGFAAAIPGTSEAEIERQYFGEAAVAPDADADDRAGRGARARQGLRIIATRHQAVLDADVVAAAIDSIGVHWPDLAEKDDAQLERLRIRLLDLGVRATTAEMGVAAAAAAAYQRLVAFLTRHVDEAEAALWAQRLTAGLVRRAPTADASMAVFAGPTWAEAGLVAPSPPTRAEPVPDPLPELESQLIALPGWRTTRILTGQFIDVRIRFLRRLANEARAMLARREQTKTVVLEIGGALRRIHLEMARRLVARGLLGDAAEIDLWSTAELRGVAAPPSAIELGRRRRAQRQYAADGLLPERFVGRPPRVRIEVPAGDRLDGLASSAGRYRGRARVLRTPRPEDLPNGDILVAAATDASWTPVFLRAGAIIVERGGPLSHAAIVARELGVPAVVAVAGATARLDGREVTVDGDEGVVVIHDPEEAR